MRSSEEYSRSFPYPGRIDSLTENIIINYICAGLILALAARMRFIQQLAYKLKFSFHDST
jgi:hypothetical protein